VITNTSHGGMGLQWKYRGRGLDVKPGERPPHHDKIGAPMFPL
jgi:hypothetical protein